MNILILGAGAIGLVFGGFLAKIGCRVSLIGRNFHIKAIKRRGLKISGIWGDHIIENLRPFTKKEEIKEEKFELVLVCVKSYDTEKILREYLSIIEKSSYIISLQNGLGNSEIISSFVGEEKTISGRVIFGVEIKGPGHVKVTVYGGKVMLGSLNQVIELNKIEEIAQIISKANIPCEATTKIREYLWEKLLYNCCLNSLAAVLEVTYGELGAKREIREIMLEICKEIFQVAKAKKVSLFWKTPEEYFQYLLSRQIPPTASHYASMLQDIKREKPTEIDFLNGAIVKMAKEMNIKVPVNEVITKIIKCKESIYLT